MKYLIDSNVWLESLMRQQRAGEADEFLKSMPIEELAISLFTIHSIGVVLVRSDESEAYRHFLDEVIISTDLAVLSLEIPALHHVVTAVGSLGLDFDDAYQYAIAERDDLTIVSFDKDFDRTSRGRLTPRAALRRRRQDDATDGEKAGPVDDETSAH